MMGMIYKLMANPRRLFLMDALGALLTALLLGIVLVRFPDIFGMPKTVLFALSLMACGFALYSFGCWFFAPKNWSPFLIAIALANLTYCVLTGGLLYCRRQQLTPWDFLYFSLEILVIVAIAGIELRVAASGKKQKL